MRRLIVDLWLHYRALLASPLSGVLIFPIVLSGYGLLFFDAVFPYRIEWEHRPVDRMQGNVEFAARNPLENASGIERPFIAYAAMVFGLGSVLVAVFRTTLHHPYYVPAYGDWLAQTPWKSPEFLPFGSPLFNWRDLPWICLMIAPMARYPYVVCWMLVLVLASGAITLAIAAWQVDSRLHAYAVAMLMGLVVRTIERPYLALAAAAAAYVAAGLGLGESLRRFPWKRLALGSNRSILKPRQPATANAQKPSVLGREELPWPYRELLGPPAVEPCSIGWAALGALLVGWWHHVAFERIVRMADSRESLGLFDVSSLFGCVIAVVLLRVILYQNGFSTPLSFFGRLAQGRFWMPAYDVIKLAPIFMLVISAVAWMAARAAGVPREIGSPIASSLAVFIALAAGPRYADWRLTGGFRLTPEWLQKQTGIERT